MVAPAKRLEASQLQPEPVIPLSSGAQEDLPAHWVSAQMAEAAQQVALEAQVPQVQARPQKQEVQAGQAPQSLAKLAPPCMAAAEEVAVAVQVIPAPLAQVAQVAQVEEVPEDVEHIATVTAAALVSQTPVEVVGVPVAFIRMHRPHFLVARAVRESLSSVRPRTEEVPQ